MIGVEKNCHFSAPFLWREYELLIEKHNKTIY